MSNAMFFKQSKPVTVQILGVILLVLMAISVYEGEPPLSQIISMSAMGIILLGYSVSYEIRSDFDNKRHIQLFGISVLKSKLKLSYPEYVTVFSARFKQNTDWGPVAALGKEANSGSFVIRLFKGNKYFTVFKTKLIETANMKAEKLAKLLGVSVNLQK